MTSAHSIEPLNDSSTEPAVRGFLHLPANDTGDALILTHGAGGNCHSRLLVELAGAFCEVGYKVVRCDLPFRQARPHGPPFPAVAARDREGLRNAIRSMKLSGAKRVFAGGHSYGGRQATMLAAEDSQLTAGLLLLSYPLHPPRRPAELRTGHFSRLVTPALFVQGSRDSFGSVAEMRLALQLISAKTMLLEVEAAGHDLLAKSRAKQLSNVNLPNVNLPQSNLLQKIVSAFQTLMK